MRNRAVDELIVYKASALPRSFISSLPRDLEIPTWEFEDIHVGSRLDRRDGGVLLSTNGERRSALSFEASDLRRCLLAF